jgi:hypothetical protein
MGRAAGTGALHLDLADDAEALRGGEHFASERRADSPRRRVISSQSVEDAGLFSRERAVCLQSRENGGRSPQQPQAAGASRRLAGA